MRGLVVGCWGLAIEACLWWGTTTASGETIRLNTKGKTIEANVLQLDDEQVIIGVPRELIATVDGQPLAAPLKEGSAAPAFTAADLAGTTQSVGDGKAKVTLLHFWVHWCPHCRSDAPQIQALYNQYRDNSSIRIITINLDQQREKVDAFITAHQVTYPVVMDAEASHAAGGKPLHELYQVRGFPVTFLIDRQGIIRHKLSGSFVETGEALGDIIQQMLSQS